ncbi:MAG: M20 family metallo-hydrolase [Spirochaetaceae bacterium]|jgi:succinyl-diaminopimelate desuccinylase|nr:M20 family metallo-hydrolase [Spirochaetaceae bacterium]
MITNIFKWIDNQRNLVVELERELCKRPAISPGSGGEGELEKTVFLQNWLVSHGITALARYDAPDPRAKGGIRPNLVATLPGRSGGGALWLIAHIDVVPPGEAALWESDPWTLVEKNGRLIGRGVEDNQQGLCAAVLAALALAANGAKPERVTHILFAADEECGSVYGIEWLLAHKPELFSKDDWALVPDSGSSDGLAIEVAEKNMLWVRFRTIGKQAHASRPDQGINAHLAGAELALALHTQLHEFFDKHDMLFEPPYSTFQITKKEANVPNINTIPGDDVFYVDMRILPCYTNSEVLSKIDAIVHAVELKHNVRIQTSAAQAHESRPTSTGVPLVTELSRHIQTVYGGTARPVGIGGGTVAAFLRNAGMDAVVWSRLDDTAHQPNEYALLDNIIGDAKVMAALMLGG